MTSVVIIGAGHNGLTCGAYLAKAGYKVNIIEASDQIGGAAATHEFATGFRVSSAAHLLYQLDEEIISDLELEQHGLALASESLDTVALDTGGQNLEISNGRIRCEGVSREDHNAMDRYWRRMQRFARVIGKLHDKTPPRIASGERSDNLSLAQLAWSIRRLGKTDMREFLRIAGINIFDILEEQFEHELLKGALSLDGLLGTHLGPRSNNSVFTTLHRMSGSVKGVQGAIALPRGGMGTVSQALAEAARSHGAEILTGARVGRIEVSEGRATGIALTTGEIMPADIVISNADPKTTCLELLGARNMDAGITRKISHVRQNGNAAKFHLALSGLPEFTGLEKEQHGHRLLIAPDLDYVERAFNHAKYKEFSTEPVMEITIPTIHDADLAPSGQHVLSAIVQYAPHQLGRGWDSAKSEFSDLVLNTLERYAPSIREQVVASELLTPTDMEERFGNAGGHWHHAELAMDQFLMLRPTSGMAQYAAPVEGLYLCGAGCHPGGGISGHPGRNAARIIQERDQ